MAGLERTLLTCARPSRAQALLLLASVAFDDTIVTRNRCHAARP
jgi:hypothetical protein